MASTRDRIIETTTELLERQGYHGTGLNQIVEESQAPKGSLYYYFPDGKEEIAAAAVDRAGKTIVQRIKLALDQSPDAATAVRGFVLALARHVLAVECRGGSPITMVALETAGASERLTRACALAYASWEAAFAAKLEASGLPRARAARLATLINASIEGAAILSRTRQSVEPLETVAEELATLIQTELAKPPVSQTPGDGQASTR